MGKRYRCIIVDDEKPAHLVLQSHIGSSDQLTFAASAYNGKDALIMLREQQFDILFLDIDMPLINGLELLDALPKRPATIITTAYQKFAFEAYQHNALDYLLKPVSLAKFMKAIDKALIFCKANNDEIKSIHTLRVLVDGLTHDLPTNDISHIEGMGNYVKIFLSEKPRPFIVYDSLKNVMAKLPSEKFIQCHKSYIINITFFEKISGNTVLLLNSETNIPLGRRYELLVIEKTKDI